MPRIQLLLAAVSSLTAGAHAQFLNRAVWLGSEIEGTSRNYAQGADYFLDRMASVIPPPWERQARFDPFQDRIYANGGSVSTSRLTVEAGMNVRAQLDETFAVRAHYLQSEHQSAQFARFAFAIEAALTGDLAGFVMFEGTPDKSRGDASAGLHWSPTEFSSHRFALTAVDLPATKSNEFEFEQQPIGLLVAGHMGAPKELQLAYEIGSQLRFVERDTRSATALAMYRTIADIECRIPISSRDRLTLRGSGELTRQTASDPGARLQRRLDHVQIGAEFWRDLGAGTHLAFGIDWLRRHDDRHFDVGIGDGMDRRWHLLATLSGALPLAERWVFEPYALAGSADYENRSFSSGTAVLLDSDDGFNGRMGLPFRYSFSERASIRFDVGISLDEAEFAGGSVQFSARF